MGQPQFGERLVTGTGVCNVFRWVLHNRVAVANITRRTRSSGTDRVSLSVVYGGDIFQQFTTFNHWWRFIKDV
jgi:hypothetical protein